MSVIWVSVFVLLGLLLRKFRFPIHVSVIPLLLLLVLSMLRMLIAIILPGSFIISSEVIYPAIINFSRFEIINIAGVPVNPLVVFICAWVIGAVIFIAKSMINFYKVSAFITYAISGLPRDEQAESILKEFVCTNARVSVYRISGVPTPTIIGFKPCILLPDIDFSHDELRVILKHEWKHYRDRDNLTRYVINFILSVFWWNPLFYILRRNISFAQEVKCDRFAVLSIYDLSCLKRAFHRIDEAFCNRPANGFYPLLKSLISHEDENNDRIRLLEARYGDLRLKVNYKQWIFNLCFSVVTICLFFGSYVVTVLPAHPVATNILIHAEHFTDEYREGGGIFSVEENFVVYNGDGTFSLYIDGLFVDYICTTHDILEHLQILARE